jgi:hypothetical protein
MARTGVIELVDGRRPDADPFVDLRARTHSTFDATQHIVEGRDADALCSPAVNANVDVIGLDLTNTQVRWRAAASTHAMERRRLEVSWPSCKLL